MNMRKLVVAICATASLFAATDSFALESAAPITFSQTLSNNCTITISGPVTLPTQMVGTVTTSIGTKPAAITVAGCASPHRVGIRKGGSAASTATQRYLTDGLGNNLAYTIDAKFVPTAAVTIDVTDKGLQAAGGGIADVMTVGLITPVVNATVPGVTYDLTANVTLTGVAEPAGVYTETVDAVVAF